MNSNAIYRELYVNGLNSIAEKSVIICGIVRDCGKEVFHNIPAIESIASKFRDYRVVMLENNSVDDTKEVLSGWSAANNKVIISLNDFDESEYKIIEVEDCYAPPFRRRRIQKYVDYRNLMLKKVREISFKADYLMVVDLDVADIDVKGVVTSFGTGLEWDAIIANGVSQSMFLQKRYHDTYALCEYGNENFPQDKKSMFDNRFKFAKLKKGMPFLRVFSGFGGLAIYKFEAIEGLNYQLIFNNAGGIEVLCEHFSLYKQMAENGYDKVFINPNMKILYQRINYKSIKRFIRNKFVK